MKNLVVFIYTGQAGISTNRPHDCSVSNGGSSVAHLTRVTQSIQLSSSSSSGVGRCDAAERSDSDSESEEVQRILFHHQHDHSNAVGMEVGMLRQSPPSGAATGTSVPYRLDDEGAGGLLQFRIGDPIVANMLVALRQKWNSLLLRRLKIPSKQCSQQDEVSCSNVRRL